jgi:hypothetical protein
MIDMKAEVLSKIKATMTGRFQRNRDGQFVGYVESDFGRLDCWLVFDDDGKPELTDPAFLKLSLKTPDSGATC